MNNIPSKKDLIAVDSRLRSVVKSLIYRFLSIIGTTTISWFITKDLKETTLLTIFFQIYLSILYYFYERVWNKISWGKYGKI